ncbi:HAMP domain-containing histidine kinase [Paenibacillus sp. DLE-14]|uniref:histidine kinase n=2 Tax=Paenibacillus lignilyticus TaxID=1172615 RepID=A0ABS5CLD0_9BACL|nr:HAMP domain-containing sensor histidine kinase [Paenibacillus lignilyticus]MBP3966661.1 HAMP domain-containing histidine kinase [Paenibacillus lignilyticus]
MLFKTKLTNAMLVFMVFMCLWQLDVSVLYSLDILDQAGILVLFKLLRIGSIMLPVAFLYVGYVTLKYQIKENVKWMNWIINKYTLGIYGAWSLFIYAVNWTTYGVTGLITIPGGTTTILYPVYGEWGALFVNHIKLLIVSIVLTLISSRKISDNYLRSFLTSFSLTFLFTYMIGVLNLKAGTFIYSSQIAVMFFSIFIFFIFVRLSTKIIRETSQILKRKAKEEQIEINTSGLIHEIGNPLTVVNGYSALLTQNEQLDPRAKGMVNQITVAGSHMSSIITNYDQFIKSGKINRADTDIMEVIQEALVLTSIRIKEKNVIMDLSEQRRMAASMDKDKMRQVFTNLINNSIEAMEGKERKVIKITIFSKNNEGTIIFADTGAGVAREEWDRIFTPFHTTKDTGMGLGLSISQRILNSHGGYIEILKSDASGTEFKVSIPLIDYKTFVTGQDMDAK